MIAIVDKIQKFCFLIILSNLLGVMHEASEKLEYL